MAQRFFEDVSVGDAIGPAEYGPITTSHIVRFSTSVETFYPLHHDVDWVRQRGMPAILVAGPFKHALLTNVVTAWAGPEAFVRRADCSHRGIDYPGTTFTVSGSVTEVRLDRGVGHVECDVELVNSDGERTCHGSYTVALPSRDGGHVVKYWDAPEELYAWAFEDGGPGVGPTHD